jgi:hypothetical protein
VEGIGNNSFPFIVGHYRFLEKVTFKKIDLAIVCLVALKKFLTALKDVFC